MESLFVLLLCFAFEKLQVLQFYVKKKKKKFISLNNKNVEKALDYSFEFILCSYIYNSALIW